MFFYLILYRILRGSRIFFKEKYIEPAQISNVQFDSNIGAKHYFGYNNAQYSPRI